MKVAVVSNGNYFSTRMLLGVFDEQQVVGTAVVRVPPGRGGPAGTLWRLSKRTGLRYAGYKAATLAVPKALGLFSHSPAFLEDLCRLRGVPCRTFASINSTDAIATLRSWEPEVLVSVSSPERFDPEVLEVPSLAAVNIHWSLLPSYAGIAPYFWVLRNGEQRTGLTIHVMAPELDAGNILRQREVAIEDRDTCLRLQLRLTRAGAVELARVVEELPGSLANSTPQDPSDRTYLTWMGRGDVRAFRARGRRLARLVDFVEIWRTLRRERAR